MIRNGNPCSFRIEDGMLKMKMHPGCLNRRGNLVKAGLIPQLSFKYGYMEGRLSKLPTGDPKRLRPSGLAQLWWICRDST